MEAFEVFGWVKELVMLIGVSRRSREQLSRVYFLMGRLRDCGFSSFDVSRLVGGRRDDSTIRKYGKGSGVVDTSGKDALLSMIGEFADEGGSLEELERFRGAKKALGGAGIGFDGAAKLALDLLNCRGSVESVSDLSSKLAGEGRTVEEVFVRIELDKELSRRGLTKDLQFDLLEAARRYGEPKDILYSITLYDGLLQLKSVEYNLQSEIKRLEPLVELLRSEKGRLDLEIGQRKDMVEAVNKVTIMGFTVASLALISVLSKKFGGPYKVADAINKYSSLKEMGDKLEKIEKETADKVGLLQALNYQIEEAYKEYNKNSDVRLVVELLSNPIGIKQDRLEMAKLLVRVLDSSAQRMDESQELSPLQKREWDTIVENIKTIANQLRMITKMKS